MGHFLLKRRRYDGTESVIWYYPTEEMAQQAADLINEQYQSDNYYVEPYDPAKAFQWPIRVTP